LEEIEKLTVSISDEPYARFQFLGRQTLESIDSIKYYKYACCEIKDPYDEFVDSDLKFGIGKSFISEAEAFNENATDISVLFDQPDISTILKILPADPTDLLKIGSKNDGWIYISYGNEHYFKADASTLTDFTVHIPGFEMRCILYYLNAINTPIKLRLTEKSYQIIETLNEYCKITFLLAFQI
jgi:hypothetical protein